MQFLRPQVHPTCLRVLHRAKLAQIPPSQPRQTRFLQTQKKSAHTDAFLLLHQKLNYLSKLSTFWLDWFARRLQFLRPPVHSTCLRVLHKAKLAPIPSSQPSQTRFLQTQKKRPYGRFFTTSPKTQLSQQAKHILRALVCLGEHCGSGLGKYLVFCELNHFVGHVCVADS